MFLFLDDERFPSDVKWVKLPYVLNWDVVRSYDEFVEYVTENGVPKYVTFDHDLCDEHYRVMQDEVNHFEYNDGDLTKTFDYGSEKTGYDCAKWLVQYCIDNNFAFPEYEVHSMNPVGSKRIKDYIEWVKSKTNI